MPLCKKGREFLALHIGARLLWQGYGKEAFFLRVL